VSPLEWQQRGANDRWSLHIDMVVASRIKNESTPLDFTQYTDAALGLNGKQQQGRTNSDATFERVLLKSIKDMYKKN
jgi:hypothetical protein